MKKVAYSLVVILILCSSNVLAAEEPSFGIALTSSKTTVNPGDEVTVTLKVKDFENMTDGIYSFLATIGYDKDVFETLTETSVKGSSSWSSVPTFNPENGLIVADTGIGVKAESDVFSIQFKVKETAKLGTTDITVKDFEASEGEEDLTANEDAKITITVEEKQSGENSGGDNTGDNKPGDDNTGDNNHGDKKPNEGTGDNKDDSTSSVKIPQTGEKDIITFSVIGLALTLAIFGYVGYKKYSKI